MHKYLVILMLLSVSALGQRTNFATEQHPAAPNYADQNNWSALPFRIDKADVVPKGEVWVNDSLKGVDVFYVHPTIYQKGKLWNADLAWKGINKKVDQWPVRMQASVFNATCRVYAPRYRQAVVGVFYNPSLDGELALELAYADVKAAFIYFLEHYSNGRPFIIAGHSQGTHHTRKLLQEMIDTTQLRHRMVAAYVVGFKVSKGMYTNLQPCDSPTDTGCYITWMSYGQGHVPTGQFHVGAESINPITWTVDTAMAGPGLGSAVTSTSKIYPQSTKAQLHQLPNSRILWVQTRAPWFRNWNNLHVADYGLFYMDIRANVAQRIAAWQRGK